MNLLHNFIAENETISEEPEEEYISQWGKNVRRVSSEYPYG